MSTYLDCVEVLLQNLLDLWDSDSSAYEFHDRDVFNGLVGYLEHLIDWSGELFEEVGSLLLEGCSVDGRSQVLIIRYSFNVDLGVLIGGEDLLVLLGGFQDLEESLDVREDALLALPAELSVELLSEVGGQSQIVGVTTLIGHRNVCQDLD
jgi:hypothetical protein